MPTNSFQLSPANAEARYQSLQFRLRFDPRADDPLFRPIDADDFRIHGASSSDFTTLRRNGLIRIVLPLPPNVIALSGIRVVFEEAEDRVRLAAVVSGSSTVKLIAPVLEPPWTL